MRPRARRGLRRAGSAPSDPTEAEGRLRRPIPERTEPLRGPSATWASPRAAAAPGAPRPTPTTPAETAVDLAYQVFDRYVEEGRRYAEGQSAWTADEGGSSLLRDVVRGGAELLSVLSRVAREVDGAGAPRGDVGAAPTAAREGAWRPIDPDSLAPREVGLDPSVDAPPSPWRSLGVAKHGVADQGGQRGERGGPSIEAFAAVLEPPGARDD